MTNPNLDVQEIEIKYYSTTASLYTVNVLEQKWGEYFL